MRFKSIRRQMMAVYLLLGATPWLVGALAIPLGLHFLTGPIAAYMVRSALEDASDRLGALSLALALNVSRQQESGDASNLLEKSKEAFPGVQARITSPELTLVYPGETEMPPSLTHLDRDNGLTVWHRQLYLFARTHGTADADVLLVVPVSIELVDQILPGFGQVEFVSVEVESASVKSDPHRPPKPLHTLDYEVEWTADIPVTNWAAERMSAMARVRLHSRAVTVYGLLLSKQSVGPVLGLFISLGVLIAAALVFVTLAGAAARSITGRITRTVEDLDAGAREVESGEFSQRIVENGNDQLGELRKAFNRMVASIERLFEESQEKHRMEMELELARDVQSRMFPRPVSMPPAIEIAAECKAARWVSGDFYDFFTLADDRITFVLGDVAGKGVSSGLMMANVMATIRSELPTMLWQVDSGIVGTHLVQMVCRLNKQLLAMANSEKYCTLFLALVDPLGNRLLYVNAGHVPPVVLEEDKPILLSSTGTVVGLLPNAEYTFREVHFPKGSMLTAFSDGITEPVNERGEQFGEDRIIDLLRSERSRSAGDVLSRVMSSVAGWQGENQKDDMTMMIVKRH